MNNLYDDFLIYRDKYGLNQGSTDGQMGKVSQNGALFTTEYLICLIEDDNTLLEVKLSEIKRLRLVFDSLEKLPGLTRRYPDSTEGDSMDNGTANLVFGAMWGDSLFPKRMQEHGRNVVCDGIDLEQGGDQNKKFYFLARLLNLFQKPKNFWNNTNPSKFCFWGWFGRSPGFMGLLDLTATGKTTLFRTFSLWVGQFISCLRPIKDLDSRKLAYVVWYYLINRGIFWRLSYRLWSYILVKRYPNGMRDVYTRYYPSNPLNVYSKSYF